MPVSWGGFKVVQATLNGIYAALNDLDLDFHWLVGGAPTPFLPPLPAWALFSAHSCAAASLLFSCPSD